ncbi:MAG: LysE family translocator [Maritimibacter sp.]|nr:LysE family translocator [Maritimibacter sp.]
MLETALALVIFLLPLAYSPGPGNLFFAALGARFGFRATLPASAGYHLATWVVTLTLGLGASAALGGAPGLFWALKLAGAGYVLWIAAGFLRARSGDDIADARSSPKPAGFRDGAVLLLLNPKAYVIIALMFSQFLGPTGRGAALEPVPGPALGPVLAITSVFTLNNLIAFSLWTVAGVRLARLFAAERSAQVLNRAFGVLLALVALRMLLG